MTIAILSSAIVWMCKVSSEKMLHKVNCFQGIWNGRCDCFVDKLIKKMVDSDIDVDWVDSHTL